MEKTNMTTSQHQTQLSSEEWSFKWKVLLAADEARRDGFENTAEKLEALYIQSPGRNELAPAVVADKET
ncbi:MAG: hypothetical protein AAF714_03160 [Pseudomonadota bacterium]